MIFRTLFLVILSGFWAGFGSLQAQEFTIVPITEQCAESEEVQLYELLMEYRRINGLPPIPFSKSLSYIARVHAMDLSFNRPDFGGCNPHSWSEKGPWKACCYARDEARLECMSGKPKELTAYRAKAWEIVYEGGEKARATDAFDLWKDIGLTRDYILNTGKWMKSWKAIGIGFYGDYASVWFGEGDDPEKEYLTCGPEPKNLNQALTGVKQEAKVISSNISAFHIIAGSLNSLEKANQEVARLRAQGYANATIIPSGHNFRISVASFPTEAEAQSSLNKTKESLPDAWLLKPE